MIICYSIHFQFSLDKVHGYNKTESLWPRSVSTFEYKSAALIAGVLVTVNALWARHSYIGQMVFHVCLFVCFLDLSVWLSVCLFVFVMPSTFILG